MPSALSSLKPRAEFVHSGLVMADEVGHESEGMSGIQLPDMSGKSKKVQWYNRARAVRLSFTSSASSH